MPKHSFDRTDTKQTKIYSRLHYGAYDNIDKQGDLIDPIFEVFKTNGIELNGESTALIRAAVDVIIDSHNRRIEDKTRP